jgi:DNA-binding SARP family transcriptional activator
VYFRILGPVDLWVGECSHPVGPWKEQSILAVLLLEAGRVVSAQTLAERVWDERMPGRARETLQVYVSRLRGRLRLAGGKSGVITSSPAGGYRLNVEPDQVDVRRFSQLISSARAASAARDPRRARELLVGAEELWRGDPLEGLTGQWAESTRQALLERRRGALVARLGLDLQLEADRGDAISELTELVQAGRIDQSAIEMLMGALAGSGREDEALAVYRSARVRLREELGVDPRPELKALHQRILRGEPVAVRSTAEPARRGALAPNTLDRARSAGRGRRRLE